MLLTLQIVSGIVHNDLMLAILAFLTVVPAGTQGGRFFTYIVKFALINILQLPDPFFGRCKILLTVCKFSILDMTDFIRQAVDFQKAFHVTAGE